MSRSDGASRIYRVRVEASSFLETATPSGIGRYTEQLIKALKDRDDIEVDIVCGVFPTSWRFANKAYRKLNHYLPTSAQLPIDLFRKKVDATIFPNFTAQRTIKSAKKLAIIHDLVYIDYPETVESKNLAYLKKEVPRSFEVCDIIVATSKTLSGRFYEIFTKRAGQQHLILPIPVGESYYSTQYVNRSSLAVKYGFPDQGYIYFIGNMEPRKNLKSLVDAYNLLPKSIRSKYSLVIAGGKGWKSQGLLSYIRDLRDAGDHIYHIGYVNEEDTVSLMHHAALHCLPSIDEGFGTSIYQAMATKTPVVANDIPILHEVGQNYVIFTDTTSAKKLSTAISAAINDTSTTMVDSAYKYVQTITWQTTIDKVVHSISD